LSDQFMRLEVKGIAKDAHERYPIKFDYSENGNAYFQGCRVHATEDIGNGKTIPKRIDVKAFGEIAEQLAHLADGMEVHLKGSFQKQKSDRDGVWYDLLVVEEVIEA
jgi:hypothetical protein